MMDPEPKLDPQITKMLYEGERTSIILDKLVHTYSRTAYPPRAVYLHSLVIHAIRTRRLELIRTCMERKEFSTKLIREHLGPTMLSPVWEAVKINDKDIFSYLLERDPDLTEKYQISIGGQVFLTSPLQAAIKVNDFDLLLAIYESQKRRHPSRELFYLHNACADASASFVAKMLKHGSMSSDVNKFNSNGHTPLCVAAWHNADIIPILLSGGSKPGTKCLDGKTALNTLCKAISSGRMERSEVSMASLVRSLLEETTESPERSALRELVSRPNISICQNAAELLEEYQDLIRLLSVRSCQKSKDLALSDVINEVYYILCYCLAYRSSATSLANAIANQHRQIIFWLTRIELLTDNEANLDVCYWNKITDSVQRANRANSILFTNRQFMENYKVCFGIIGKVLRRLPPCSDADRSDFEKKLLELISGQPDLCLRFLCIYMESCTLCQTVDTTQRFLAEVKENENLMRILKILSERVWTLQYVVKKRIKSLLRGKDYVKNIPKLSLPKALQNYLLEDEIE